MSRWAWVRLAGGAAILGLVVWRVGTGPFLDGVRAVDGTALTAALAIGGLTTVCSAWRWSLVAAGLGVRLSVPRAFAAYYRSQFLNTALPGGVLGDVHRAVRHGRDIGNVTLGVRAVVVERVAGQGVAVGIAAMVLFALPSPLRAHVLLVGLLAAGVVGLALAVRAVARRSSGRWVRVLRQIRSDVRRGVLARGNLTAVVGTSAIVLAGNLTMFLLAARAAGSTAPLAVLAPVTLLALLAMIVPLNVAGWGPREGVAAWAFGAAGLTADEGVAAAVTYGVLVVVATLPGAAFLVLRHRRLRPAAVEMVGGADG